MSTHLTSGVTLSVNKTGTGSSYTKLTQIISIDGPGGSTDALEITDYDSTVREFRSGLHDPGEMSVEFNFDVNDPEHKWLMSRPVGGETYAWRIAIPTEPKATHIEFAGFVTAANPGLGAPGEVITGSATIKITDVITWSEDD